MNTKLLLFIVVLGAILGMVSILQPIVDKNPKLISSDKPPGGDFTLNSIDGEVSLSDFKGKLVFIYFGYTFCPDICPTNLGYLSLAYQKLSEQEKQQVQILLVSVDPERDTVERLKPYTDYFESDMIGLTGSPEYIAEIAKRYGVVYAKVEDSDKPNYYAVDHSAFTYVVDQEGQLQEQLPHATSTELFMQTMNIYLK